MVLLLIHNLAIIKITFLRGVLKRIPLYLLDVGIFLKQIINLMLIRDLFVKRKPRSFGFTPFYYEENKSTGIDRDTPRIQFQRIRTNITFGKRSMTSMVVVAVLFGVMLIHFLRMVERDLSTSELEKIRIEIVPNGLNP